MRRDARESAFKLIYESLFNKEVDLSKSELLLNFNEQDKAFTESLLSLFLSHKEELLLLVGKYVKGYEISRVYKIDLALLLLAVTEIKYTPETPVEVVINEVVELSKKYSTEKSSGFIHGTLGSIVKDV